MNEMLKTIEPKSDQLNVDDLSGGRTKTIKITKAKVDLGDAQSCTLWYEGDNGKPYKPGKSMRRIIVNAWGADVNQYIGKSLTLYTDDSVRFGADMVGGLRISHMSHIGEQKTFALTVTRGKKKPFTVKPLLINETEAPKVDEALVAAGQEAANKGLEAYTAWGKGLTVEQKASVKHLLSGWLVEAKAVVSEEGVI